MALAMDEADVGLPTPLDGRSLYPHVVGDPGHDEVLGEYYAEGNH